MLMITISRLPAAEAHEKCASAVGRQKHIQATLLRLSVQARAGFIPRWSLDCTEHTSKEKRFGIPTVSFPSSVGMGEFLSDPLQERYSL